jgi:hypothetical protein
MEIIFVTPTVATTAAVTIVQQYLTCFLIATIVVLQLFAAFKGWLISFSFTEVIGSIDVDWVAFSCMGSFTFVTFVDPITSVKLNEISQPLNAANNCSTTIVAIKKHVKYCWTIVTAAVVATVGVTKIISIVILLC